ncbi:MAG TPA: glycosyltransferase family 2 protein [Thermodesulfovibrionales bacterium]|nr:glycosyltransferase family 2 protein [Thermodesulfovibrionales bacterium]
MLKGQEKLVSILVVSYNAQDFIAKTIRSCLQQSYRNIELLILDNKSDDKTVDVINSFKDPRLHVYRGDHTFGPYDGLNYLIEHAAGEYIAIQDHDDVWFHEKIETQIRFLNDNRDFVACGTNTYFFYEDKGVFILIENPFIADIVNHTSLVFRKDSFRYDTDYLLADEHFMRKVLRHSGSIACLQEPLCVHRIRADAKNLSSYRFSLSKKNIKDFFMINGITMQSVKYFCYLMTRDVFPEFLLWHIRRHVTLKNREWIGLSTFRSRYPKVLL